MLWVLRTRDMDFEEYRRHITRRCSGRRQAASLSLDVMSMDDKLVIAKLVQRCKVALYFVALFAIVSLGVHLLDLKYNFIGAVAFTWRRPYTLLTYSWIHVNPWHFVGKSIAFLLAALIVEPRLTKPSYLFLLLTAPIVGALMFSVVDRSQSSVIGSGFLVAASQGAVIACWLKGGKAFHAIEKLYAYLLIAGTSVGCIILVYRLIADGYDGLAVSFARLLAMLYGLIYVRLTPLSIGKHEEDPKGHNQGMKSDQ